MPCSQLAHIKTPGLKGAVQLNKLYCLYFFLCRMLVNSVRYTTSVLRLPNMFSFPRCPAVSWPTLIHLGWKVQCNWINCIACIFFSAGCWWIHSQIHYISAQTTKHVFLPRMPCSQLVHFNTPGLKGAVQLNKLYCLYFFLCRMLVNSQSDILHQCSDYQTCFPSQDALQSAGPLSKLQSQTQK